MPDHGATIAAFGRSRSARLARMRVGMGVWRIIAMRMGFLDNLDRHDHKASTSIPTLRTALSSFARPSKSCMAL